MKHNKKTRSQRKTKEDHLEEGKAARPTKGTKSGKTTKRARKTQNQSLIYRHKQKTKRLLFP
jgi:hypothetical protein